MIFSWQLVLKRLYLKLYYCSGIRNWDWATKSDFLNPTSWQPNVVYLKYTLLGCLGVCLLPINVKTSELHNIFCGTSHDPRQGLWVVSIEIFAFKILIFQNPQKKSIKEQQSRVKIAEGRKASWMESNLNTSARCNNSKF